MKKIVYPLVLVAMLILAGCATSRPGTSGATDLRPRFKDGAEASLIVDFNSWEYTYVRKPEVVDGPYRREVSTNEIGSILMERRTPRKLAVVKLGWLLNDEELQDTMNRWQSLLKQMDFVRIVFVRPIDNAEFSGALILHDSQNANNPPLESFRPKLQDARITLIAKGTGPDLRSVSLFASP